jgi:hypothetical protein
LLHELLRALQAVALRGRRQRECESHGDEGDRPERQAGGRHVLYFSRGVGWCNSLKFYQQPAAIQTPAR